MSVDTPPAASPFVLPTHVDLAMLAELKRLRDEAQRAQLMAVNALQGVRIQELAIAAKYYVGDGGSWDAEGRITRAPSAAQLAAMGLNKQAEAIIAEQPAEQGS